MKVIKIIKIYKKFKNFEKYDDIIFKFSDDFLHIFNKKCSIYFCINKIITYNNFTESII